MLRRALAIVAVNVLLLAALLLALEGVFRLLVSYDIGYYVGAPGPGRYVRPYGELRINRLGHPDGEWDLDDPRPRVGWLGDSVVAGVGAGYGHRFEDLLRERHPQLQHLALGGVGDLGIQQPEVTAAALAALHLDRLVYVMNLNDVLPDVATGDASVPASVGTVPAEGARGAAGAPPGPAPAAPRSPGLVWRIAGFVRGHLDGLRGRSYLYNWMRTQVKLALTRAGYEYHGMQAFELFPRRNAAVFEATCRRVEAFAALVRAQGTRFEVVLLPYEMQISEAAARRYAELGIHWEPGFEAGSAQAELAACLDGIPVHDARAAFASTPAERARIGVGELFVYDLGDKLDWNHPNRAGHARLAAFLEERLPWLSARRTGPERRSDSARTGP